MGNPEFSVGRTELWVPWTPCLRLACEVGAVLWQLDLKPVESDANSG